MERKIFLEKNRGVFSNNAESSVDVELSAKTRLLPEDNLSDDFSLLAQYNKERDNCEKIRAIFTINPICSNILFNMKTEIVVKEGSDDCAVVYDGSAGRWNSTIGGLSKAKYAPNAVNTTSVITYRDAMGNTEYSHKTNGGFVYHCGADIFSNPMLRSKKFVHVNKISTNAQSLCSSVYNTISDYLRNGQGEIVEQDIAVKYSASKPTKMHLYQYDMLDTTETAFKEKCREVDGWWGFTNPGNIEIDTRYGSDTSTNRLLSGNKPCEFIDLYPDRSLYSFIPKYNKYRKRAEKNWDYCITYPYKSDTSMVDRICHGENGAMRANIKKKVNSSGIEVLQCASYFKHTLSAGSFINIYYYEPTEYIENTSNIKDNEELFVREEYIKGDMTSFPFRYTSFADAEKSPYSGAIKKVFTFYVKDETFDDYGNPTAKSLIRRETKSVEFKKNSVSVKVISVGDSDRNGKDRYFSVRVADIASIYTNLRDFGFYWKKTESGTECEYYFRKFKKLKNEQGGELRSDINKIAFARNIYGDDMAQLLFLDDISLSGLRDNRNRPISEVYLTIIKRHRGDNLWYEKQNYTNESIEYSHCFGKVTSGIDFNGIDEEPFDYNVHYLHNIDKSTIGNTTSWLDEKNTLSAWGETILAHEMPKTLEDDITIADDEFYGDVVEFSLNSYTESIIGNVYHRFNTAQRETWNDGYMSMYADDIYADDYDVANGSVSRPSFEVRTYFLNNIDQAREYANKQTGIAMTKLMHGNICPEGYYYNPHIKLKVREDDTDVTTADAKYINLSSPEFYSINDTETGDLMYYEMKFNAPTNLGFYTGDYMAMYDKETQELSWGEIQSVSGKTVILRFDDSAFSKAASIPTPDDFRLIDGHKRYFAFWSTKNVPLYARFVIGKQKFIWRKTIAPSEMIRDMELYDTPFTNGRFYMEKNVSFFLRRQDPTGKYGLSIPLYKKIMQTKSNPMLRFNITGYDPVDVNAMVETVSEALNPCW